MNGIDPYGYVQQASGQLAELKRREQIEPVLDELEYLYEVMDPELQETAEQLIGVLRARLAGTKP